MSLRQVISAAALVLSVGVLGCGSDNGAGNPDSEVSLAQATAPLSGAPPELEAVRREANQLLGGGADAFGERLKELRGTPVVVNKWASWCGPCRFEFPFFQSQAFEHGADIAFLGIDSNDSVEAAERFLEELPLPYPSYLDPDQEIAKEFLDNATREFPATGFYDADGELAYLHLGGYPDEETLAADVDRYAGEAG